MMRTQGCRSHPHGLVRGQQNVVLSTQEVDVEVRSLHDQMAYAEIITSMYSSLSCSNQLHAQHGRTFQAEYATTPSLYYCERSIPRFERCLAGAWFVGNNIESGNPFNGSHRELPTAAHASALTLQHA